ncbi:hypothetical protein [Shewanella algae]|uniref:hypothetical protein n=1 Tax=Shewanella algae TaxID=38313 RepID=UPI0031F48FA0
MKQNKTNVAKDRSFHRLKKELGCSSVRFTAKDTAMFADLAKVGILSAEQMASNHYHENRKPQERISKLVEAGLLKEKITYDRKRGKIVAYTFASRRVARVFGGWCPNIGNRTVLHEVMVSEAYFRAGKPADFQVASRFDEQTHNEFNSFANKIGIAKPEFSIPMESCLPDAIYTDSGGNTVVVEADAGSYDKEDVTRKATSWSNYKQLWIQPNKCRAPITGTENMELIKF